VLQKQLSNYLILNQQNNDHVQIKSFKKII